ncbi:MAG: N-acetylmuramoyl-L-alanine amidase [Bacteroidota bacterium]|nr:N-acetylmuramoyl-L-alanine amidase [Bacteroidota bacterium]
MNSLRYIFIVVFFFSCQLFSQIKNPPAIAAAPDSLFLRVIVPETDTTVNPFSSQRISASTLPSARAFINGKETKVYSSGAFCGVVNVPVDTSMLRLVVRAANGDSLEKDFVLERPEPLKTSPSDPVVIDSTMMKPAEDLWLGAGDILEVRFKGSPGHEAWFDIEGVESDIPMTELPPSQANGLGGVYIGRYKVREGDDATDTRIRFHLKKSFWSSEKAYAKAKVSIIPKELPRVAEAKGKNPFLNAGLGSDRLGGAKLGFIQSGVRVVVTGKVGRQYRVRLSDDMEAWLPEYFLSLLPLDTPLPHSLVGSLFVTGKDSGANKNQGEDVITVSLSERLPYLSEQRVNPAQLIVDIFGATSNTNWITQQLSSKGIKSVTWQQRGADRYRLIITLAYQQHWGYDIGYVNGSTMKITLRRPPAIASHDAPLSGLTIAVDAGHGGDNNGAVGSTGALEKNMTLMFAKNLDSLLTLKGVNAVMTRTGDDNVSMAERTDKIISSGAQILVSIHCNSIGETTDPSLTKGVSTYYRYIGFQPLAEIMYGKMLELGLDQQGCVGSFNFSLNGPTQLPNVLVETAFLSNPEDEIRILDPAFREQVAEQIVKGLEEFVKTKAAVSTASGAVTTSQSAK